MHMEFTLFTGIYLSQNIYTISLTLLHVYSLLSGHRDAVVKHIIAES